MTKEILKNKAKYKKCKGSSDVAEMFKCEKQLLLQELNPVINSVNMDEYIEFRGRVKQSMKYPEWLGDFSKEELINMQNDNTVIWLYYLDDEPICSMMLIPGTKKALNEYGIDLDYSEVVDYGPMFVNLKYVGNGLQYQMLNELHSYSAKLGYKYAVVTVHPDNIYSIKNLLKDDFKLIGRKEFSRGIRNIYLRKIDLKN